MRNSVLKLMSIAAFSASLFAFSPERDGGIQGRVSPAEGVKEIVAVAGADTLRSQLSNGMFVFSNVKKGTYRIWIKANAPYKDATVENVAVADSATTDIGEIKLLQ